MSRRAAALLALFALAMPAVAQVRSTKPIPSKDYVDPRLDAKLPRSGGEMTGGLTCAPGAKCDVSGLSVTASGGTAALTNAEREALRPTPLDFLAPSVTPGQLRSAAVNASPAISAALALHGDVVLPCGQYRLDAPPTWPGAGRSLKGISRSCVILLINFPAGNVIDIGDPGATWSGIRLSRLHMFAAVKRTSGYAVRLRNTYEAEISDVVINGPQAGCVEFDGGRANGFGNRLGRFILSSCSQAGIHVTGYARDTFVTDGIVGASPTSLHIDDASGFYSSNVDYSPALGADNKAPNVLVNPQSGQNVNGLFFTAALSDSCGGDCWLFAPGPDDTSGAITEVYITGGWGSGSSSGAGLRVTNPKLDGLALTNFHIHHNWQEGIRLEAGRNITIGSGTMPVMNSVAGSALYDGIFIGPNADRVTVVGARGGDGGYMKAERGFTNLQRWGLYGGVGTGDLRRITVSASQFDGNVIGGMQLPTGPRILIEGEERIAFATPSTVPGGTVTFLGPQGVTTGESGALYTVPYDAVIRAVHLELTAAPGAGQTAALTVRSGGSDTTAAASVTGASGYIGDWAASGGVTVSAGSTISLKFGTTSGAAATQARGHVLLMRR